MTQNLTPAPINQDTKLDWFISEMTLDDHLKTIENRVHTITYWQYSCLCLLSYAVDDNWMRLDILQGELNDREEVRKRLEQWMEPTSPMYIVQKDGDTYRFYYSAGWENLTYAPIDDKNVMSDFTEAFHNGECMLRTDERTRYEYFIHRDCLCEVVWTFGHHRFIVHPLYGHPVQKDLCKSDFQRMADEMNNINTPQGLIVKNLDEGCYAFYFTPETQQ